MSLEKINTESENLESAKVEYKDLKAEDMNKKEIKKFGDPVGEEYHHEIELVVKRFVIDTNSVKSFEAKLQKDPQKKQEIKNEMLLSISWETDKELAPDLNKSMEALLKSDFAKRLIDIHQTLEITWWTNPIFDHAPWSIENLQKLFAAKDEKTTAQKNMISNFFNSFGQKMDFANKDNLRSLQKFASNIIDLNKFMTE